MSQGAPSLTASPSGDLVARAPIDPPAGVVPTDPALPRSMIGSF